MSARDTVEALIGDGYSVSMEGEPRQPGEEKWRLLIWKIGASSERDERFESLDACIDAAGSFYDGKRREGEHR